MAHGAVGALALLVLVAHTGMRLGSGFNRVLLITYLAAAALGSVAAVGASPPSDWSTGMRA